MAIPNEDLEYLKEIFVTRQECDTRNDEVTQCMNNIKIDLAVIKDNLATQRSYTKAILTAIIGLIVAAVWNILTNGAM